MKKYIPIALFTLVTTLSGCSPKVDPVEPVVGPHTLETPEVTINETGLASWLRIENALSYLYRINNSSILETNEVSIQLNDKDTITVAANGDGVNYLTSDFSDVKTYTKVNDEPIGDDPVDDDPIDDPVDDDDEPYVSIFDDKNIVLSFPLITDEHVGYKDATHDNKEVLKNTLQTLQDFRKDVTFDLIVSAGDQTQNGKKTEVDDVMEVYNSIYDLDKTPFFFSHGNHDTQWSGCMSRQEFYNAYGTEVYKYDLDHNAAKLGNRHIKRNGFHFISLEFDSYGNDRNTFGSGTETWLKKVVKEASQEDPTKPVFVVGHCPIYETIPGSFSSDNTGDWGASKTLYSVLRKYSNVFYLSGHTHYNIHDERAIFQNKITVVQAACASDLEMDDRMEGVSQLPNRRDYSFGQIVEVDKDNNVRISRHDLNKKQEIMKPWEIMGPKEDGSHLNKYSASARKQNTDAPKLPKDGHFFVKHTSNKKLVLDFTPFVSKNGFIFSYKAVVFPMNKDDITDEGEDSILDYPWLEEWYNYPQPRTETIEFELPGNYKLETDWTVKLYATDCLGHTTGMFMQKKDMIS